MGFLKGPQMLDFIVTKWEFLLYSHWFFLKLLWIADAIEAVTFASLEGEYSPLSDFSRLG